MIWLGVPSGVDLWIFYDPDADGPDPAEWNKVSSHDPVQHFDWNLVRQSFDDHYTAHWTLKDEKMAVDVAGLDAVQQRKIRSYLQARDPAAELYELIEE